MSDERKLTLAELKALSDADYAAHLSDAEKRIELASAYAQTGLKSLFLVNGASIIALLTFLGNGGALDEPQILKYAFMWFTGGIGSALGAFFGGYFAQSFAMHVSIAMARNAQAIGHGSELRFDPAKDLSRMARWDRFATGAAALSLICFLVGAFVALDAIT